MKITKMRLEKEERRNDIRLQFHKGENDVCISGLMTRSF